MKVIFNNIETFNKFELSIPVKNVKTKEAGTVKTHTGYRNKPNLSGAVSKIPDNSNCVRGLSCVLSVMRIGS